MGVTGLWTVVQPCARPIKLETLNKKRLAVDASIWIYQFLKAVRDKEGNALRNSHVVGFFRRICKLLYFGIKPVFVFDGGAPALKRQTIAGRKRRREGRREDAVRTAGKLLATQMQRRAEEEEAKRKGRQEDEEAEIAPENMVYVDELFMTPKERQQNRTFRKKDAYHLPDLDVSLEHMGAPDDPRIMSHEELEQYAQQFHSGEDINLYDFSKIDFNSPFFLSLPPSDRYNILNAARLRSRLRMGYSKEQLDTMFPDRMAFSRFQIERVKERNDLTQRLMNLNGMNGEEAMLGLNQGSRIAGERGKEYVLVKNNGVEGGWALGVVGNKGEGQANKPIDVDKYGQQEPLEDGDEWEDQDGFEDVPIEGLNRLPKLPALAKGVFDESIKQQIAEKRRAVYEHRRQAAATQAVEEEDDSLFVADDTGTLFHDLQPQDKEDDEELNLAIQMSLEPPPDDSFRLDDSLNPPAPTEGANDSGSIRGIIREASQSDDDDDMDLFMAVAKSKISKPATNNTRQFPKSNPFDGPLPFESLKIHTSSPHPKPAQGTQSYENAGGFEKEPPKEQEASQPLPPWFSGVSQKKDFIEDKSDDAFTRREGLRGTTFQDSLPDVLSGNKPSEVIDVDNYEANSRDIINVDGSDDEEPTPKINDRAQDVPPIVADTNVSSESKPGHQLTPEGTVSEDTANIAPETSVPGEEEPVEWDATDDEDNTPAAPEVKEVTSKPEGSPRSREESASPTPDFEDVNISEPPNIIQEPIDDEVAPQPDSPPNESYEDHHIPEDQEDYSDPEDEDLLRQLAAEADEHARFASTLNSKTQAENAADYDRELKQLRAQQKKDRRDADEVTHIMVTECQQLLKLFGLPYITAPMEAEAQCAELVSLGLVDGIVTDDSDIFLFGGTRVYKNMFNQGKFVECYLSSDLEKEYALDQKKLIRFAHLLGSDYTEGIPGIGPVTALEILTEFGMLEDFRDWWTQVQTGATIPEDVHAAFRKKFRKNISKLFLPPAFPDTRVDEAYLHPEVDSDPSAFRWGVPDLNALRQFLMSTIGWSQERTDEVLVPVIRDMNRRETEGTQSNITGFFSGPQGAGAFAPRQRTEGSGRMGKAFTRLRNEAEARKQQQFLQGDKPSTEAPVEEDGEESEEPQGNGRSQRTRKRSTKAPTDSKATNPSKKRRRTGKGT
ncbi:DNA repair protein rad2 [Arachnomyces sp. PD_36]|nr:DNA repair protein rad2 [Arachnomyces sp. PD_36]